MANSIPSSQVQIPASNTPPIIQPSNYHGISSQSRKWKAQVYSWVHFKTVYLGTYSTPQMAAIAYDVGALALSGDKAVFNFPDAIWFHPVPKSISIVDIRAAAMAAATQFSAMPEAANASEVSSQEIHEYVDEEELFNMPQILIEMAEGLMVSPPRFGPPEFDEPLEVLEDDNLWNFDA